MKGPIDNLLYQKHIISISGMNRDMLELIVLTTERIKKNKPVDLLKGKIISSCFFEPSTRTRLSFDAAINRLGGTTIGFDDSSNTSFQKGETLSDSIRVISSYTDALIIRHPRAGAAQLAAECSSVPVINAGDGSNQHPSQTLLDIFSIYECQGRLNQLTVACVGDLKYGRTVHSLVEALVHFKVAFIFISPQGLEMPVDITEMLDSRGIKYRLEQSIEAALPEVDILYMTRIQKERIKETEYKYIPERYALTKAMLQGCKPGMKILHPLPRINEISLDVDQTPYAYYFEQAKNGIYARMALLSLILNETINLNKPV